MRFNDMLGIVDTCSRIKRREAMSPAPKFDRGTALPLTYEVSCRTRTGSVRRKSALCSTISPVFRSGEALVPPRY
jgi:hypothetical protein